MPTIEELKARISDLPNQYIAAMEVRTKLDNEVERLEVEIEYLKIKLKQENEVNEVSTGDDEFDVVSLEAEQERLKLKLDEAESRAELEFGSLNPKATESNVKAAVTIDEKVFDLREKHLEAKIAVKMRKAEYQKERSARFEERRLPRLKGIPAIQSNELIQLQEKLLQVESDRTKAYAEIKNLEFTLETYKLLGALTSINNLN